MSWVTLMIVALVVVSLIAGISMGKELEDFFGGFLCSIVCLTVSFFVLMVFGSYAHEKDAIIYQEEIEVSAITFGDKSEVSYVPVSTMSANGQLATTVVPTSTSKSNVTYINKETGKVGEFSPDMGTFLVGNENKMVVTYSELTEDNAWYGVFGKDKTAIEYIVTMIEEK